MDRDLAVVIMTCDKYSFLWDAWHHHFRKHFGFEQYPVYFCSETQTVDCDETIPVLVDIPDFSRWTERVHKSIEQVPHKDVFLLLDDIFLTADISSRLDDLYAAFLLLDAHALRILLKPSKAAKVTQSDVWVGGRNVNRLTQKSKYLISYTPNIWKRSFLLRCTEGAMNIWESEVKGSKAFHSFYHRIFSYIYPDWYIGATRQGEVIPEGQLLIDEAKREKDSSSS
jgi:hypothetical protein